MKPSAAKVTQASHLPGERVSSSHASEMKGSTAAPAVVRRALASNPSAPARAKPSGSGCVPCGPRGRGPLRPRRARSPIPTASFRKSASTAVAAVAPSASFARTYPASARSWLCLVLLTVSVIGCGKPPPSRGPDFSQADSVTIQLGDSKTEYGSGLQHRYHEKDGLTTPATRGGRPCRHLSVVGFSRGFLYFVIDQTFKQRSVKNVEITVEYFDEGFGTLGLQFDASGSKKNRHAAYTDSGIAISLFDSKTWKQATFPVHNAAFENSQNSGSDFRLTVSPPELSVHRVTATRAK